MNIENHDPDRQAVAPFCAVLRPHRSLSPRGFILLMAAISAVSFAAGLVFWWIGAWPVMGFFGLDVALIYIAFRCNYRSARMSETIAIGSETLSLTRRHPSGRTEQVTLNPYWTRVEVAPGRDGRVELAFRLHRERVPFGRFLAEDERREVAEILRVALLQARGGPRI